MSRVHKFEISKAVLDKNWNRRSLCKGFLQKTSVLFVVFLLLMISGIVAALYAPMGATPYLIRMVILPCDLFLIIDLFIFVGAVIVYPSRKEGERYY